MKHLPIRGVADAVHIEQRHLIELKFSKSGINMTHGLQAMGYAEMLDGAHIGSWKVDVYNLYDGSIHAIKAPTFAENRFALYKCLSTALDTPLKHMVFVYDLETTGLYTGTCDIIDIHVEELNTGLVPLSTLVDTPQALSLEISKLTGIVKKDLEDAPGQAWAMRQLCEALSLCDTPLMIAHNGIRFDFKVLKNKLASIQYKAKFLDSVELLRMFMSGNASMKLMELYNLLGSDPVQAHRAAADVYMLCKILHNKHIDDYDQILAMSNKADDDAK